MLASKKKLEVCGSKIVTIQLKTVNVKIVGRTTLVETLFDVLFVLISNFVQLVL